MKEQDTHLQALLDHSKDFIWSLSVEGKLTAFNRAFHTMWRRYADLDAKPGLDLLTHLPPDRRSFWSDMHQRAMKGKAFSFDHPYERPGFSMKLEVNAHPIRGDHQAVTGVAYVGRDTKERRQDKRNAREPDVKYRQIMESAGDAILLCDHASTSIIDANSRAHELLGYDQEALIGLPMERIHPPGEFDRLRHLTESDFLKHGFASDRILVQHKSGRTIPVDISASVFDLDGQKKVLAILRDAGDRERMENALRESEAKYRVLADAAQDSIFVIDHEDRVSYVNRMGAIQWGCRPEDIIGRPRSELFPPDVSKQQKYWLDRIFETGEPTRRESRGAFPGGEVWLDTYLVPLKNEGGEVTAILGVARDITGHKRIEDALRESQQQYQITIDSLGDGIHVIDRDFRIVLVNKALLKTMKELSLQTDLIGASIFDVCPFLSEQARNEYNEVFLSGHTLLTEDRTMIGERAFVTETRKIPVFKDGQVARVITVLRDITDRRQTEDALRQSEEQLRQSQKMEAIGRLAGGVAHDFNNLLTSILGFSHLALDELPEGHAVAADIREVIQGAERATKLTQQLLAMGRRQMLQIVPLDLNTVVVNMEQLLRRTLGEDIELVTFLGEDLGSVEADAGYLEQVILNLAVNARDAMPQGGTLLIRTMKKQMGDIRFRLPGGIQPGEYVALVVRDTGCGMNREIQEHAFEPFYTTKEHGKGTGLGLTMVYGIVKQCHGHIELESPAPRHPDLDFAGLDSEAHGPGTEVRIFFPGVQSPAERPVQLDEMYVPHGTESILVVEDEDAVRRFAVRILGTLGYRVTEARNALEAIGLCQDRNRRFDLILSDVVMPQVSGPDMVHRIREIRKDFKVLFATGFTQDTITRHGLGDEEGHDAVILKPFTREALAVKIRQVLDATG